MDQAEANALDAMLDGCRIEDVLRPQRPNVRGRGAVAVRLEVPCLLYREAAISQDEQDMVYGAAMRRRKQTRRE